MLRTFESSCWTLAGSCVSWASKKLCSFPNVWMIQLPQAGIHRKTLPNWCQLLPSGWFFAHAAKSFWKPSTVTKPPELAEPPMKEPCRCTNLTSFVMICHWLMRSKCHEFRQMPKNGPNWPNRVIFFTVDHGCLPVFSEGTIALEGSFSHLPNSAILALLQNPVWTLQPIWLLVSQQLLMANKQMSERMCTDYG